MLSSLSISLSRFIFFFSLRSLRSRMGPKRQGGPIPLSAFLSGEAETPGERLPSGPGEGGDTVTVGSRRWIAEWGGRTEHLGLPDGQLSSGEAEF